MPHIATQAILAHWRRSGALAVLASLGHRAHKQPCKDQEHSHPLLGQQWVAIPDDAEKDVEELAGGRNERVHQRTECADREKDEKLPHSAAQAEEQDVPGRVRVGATEGQ